MIPIYKPCINKYKNLAYKAIESEWISSLGSYVQDATEKFKDFFQVPYCILMSNGTVATHCLFIALKHTHPKIKKIYVPNNVYVAAWNSLLYEYKLTNIEVLKIDPETWNLDASEKTIKGLEKNSAILVVHNLGNIVNVNYIKELRPDIVIIEDNCEGIFGKYENSYSGTSKNSLCSSASFYANKTITSGEGGLFLTHDKEIYNYVNRVYDQGMSSQQYVHNILAYNYRITNIQAGFLLAQMNDIENILKSKQTLFDNYQYFLEPLIKQGKIKLQKTEKSTQRACWMFALQIIGNQTPYKKLNQCFLKKGFETRPFFYPITKHKHFNKLSFNDKNAELLAKEIIMIPSYPELKEKEQKFIVSVLQDYLI